MGMKELAARAGMSENAFANIHGAIGRNGIDTYSLDLIAEWVVLLSGIPCSVYMSGGNVATVAMGELYWTYEDGSVGPHVDDFDYPRGAVNLCTPVLAGPGHFDGPGWSIGRSYPEEFSIGYDNQDPLIGDDGDCVDGFGLDPVDEKAVAERMIRFYRDHPRVRAGELPNPEPPNPEGASA